MTNSQPSHLVPKLRFAKFIDEPPWECLPLKKLAKRITQRNTHGADLRALTNSAEHGVVDQREYFDRDIATNTDNYYIVELGDYVYNPRISSTAPVGPICKNQIGTGVMSPLYTVFRFWSDANDFFAHYFKSSRWHGYLRRVSNTGARHDRMSITNDDLMQMPIPTPSPHEQHKVADCLGSLDDLIAAADRKLEALRQHKQGLMQQLFPQPGESVPRLRFPQFQNAPAWSFESIDEFAQTMTGIRDTQDKVDGGSYPFFVRSQSSERINTYVYNGEAVLTSGDGVGVGKNFHYIDGKFDFHQRVYCIYQFKSHVLGLFFFYYFSERFGPRVRRMSAKNSVDSVRRSMITDMPIPLPGPAEQKTIADCLSAHDTLIDAQVAKLDTLRTHKQGLLQQLFPPLESQ